MNKTHLAVVTIIAAPAVWLGALIVPYTGTLPLMLGMGALLVASVIRLVYDAACRK